MEAKIMLDLQVGRLFLMGGIFLSGCAGIPEYEYSTPLMSSDVAYQDLLGRVSEGPEPGEILTRDRVRKIALANNPNLKAIEQAVLAARSVYQQAMAVYYPQIYVSSSNDLTHSGYLHQDPINRVSQVPKESLALTDSLSLNAQYLLFDGYAREMNRLASQFAAESHVSALEDAKRLLLERVDNQFYNIILLHEQLQVQENDLQFQRRMFELSQLKLEKGVDTKIPVINFQVHANLARENIVQYKYQIQVARNVLAALMGLLAGNLDDTVTLPELETLLKPEYKLEPLPVYLQAGLEDRPDLQQYRQQIQAAEYTLYSRYSRYFPSIYLGGAMGLDNTGIDYDNPDYSFRENTYNLSVGLRLQWDLFTGFHRKYAVEEARANVAQQEENLHKHWLEVAQEIQTAYNIMQSCIERIPIVHENLQLAEEVLALIEEQFKMGTTDISLLNETQNKFVQLQGLSNSLFINLLTAEAQLRSAIGANAEDAT